MLPNNREVQLRREAFQALQVDIAAASVMGDVVLLGDFNSRVGRDPRTEAHVGPFMQDDGTNSNGNLLRSVLTTQALYILNGRKQSSTCGDYTYVHPNGSSCIDFIIAGTRVLQACMDPASGCDLHVHPAAVQGTLHKLVHMRLPTSTPKYACRPPPATSVPRLHLLRSLVPVPVVAAPSNDSPPAGADTTPTTYRDIYQVALRGQVNGYKAFIQDLTSNPAEKTPEQVVQAARHELERIVSAAVGESIGLARVIPGASHPWWRQVASMIKSKHNLAKRVTVARRTQYVEYPRLLLQLRSLQAATSKAISQAKAQAKAAKDEAIRKAFRTSRGKASWQVFNRAYRTRQQQGPAMLQNREGSMVLDDAGICKAFAHHYEALGDAGKFAEGADFDEEHERQVVASVQRFLHESRQHHTEALDNPISAEEIATCVFKLTNYKACSPIDKISNELLKYGYADMIELLEQFFNLQWTLERSSPPPGVVVSLYKNGDSTHPGNYRGITLTSCIDKLYNAVITKRLQKYLEVNNLLHEGQNGFRPGRSCADHLFTLSQTLLGRKRGGLGTYVLFLDTYKAYDVVWRDGLLWHLWYAGVNGRMFRVICNMYGNTRAMATHNGCTSGTFNLNLGLAQGDTLSPLLFTVFINSLLNTLDTHPGVPIGASQDALRALMFADDLAAVASSRAAMQSMVNDIYRHFKRWRLKANIKEDGTKTALMCCGPVAESSNQQSIRWGEQCIPEVRTYKYLGVLLTDDLKWDKHIAMVVEKAGRAAGALQSFFVSANVDAWLKRMMYLTLVRPVVENGAQIWGPTCTQANIINSQTQMAWLKAAFKCPVSAATYPLLAEFGLRPMISWLELRMLEYWRVLEHMPASRLPKKVAQAHWPQVGRGRHPRMWTRVVEDVVQGLGLIREELRVLSKGKYKSAIVGAVDARDQGVFETQCGGPVNANSVRAVYARNMNDKLQYGVVQPYLCKGKCTEGKLLLLQMRVGCLPVLANLRRSPATSPGEAPVCPACGASPESSEHFLCECPSMQVHRSRLLSVLQQVDEQHGAISPTMPRGQMMLKLLKTNWNPAAQVALEAFVAEAWRRRAGFLSGREEEGSIDTDVGA